MNEDTNISWTHDTWNPVHGCSKVSPGCENCYAERQSHRWGHTDKPWTPEHADENVLLKPHKLEDPYSISGARRVFVNSTSDLFHAEVPESYIRNVFGVMRNCPHLVFIILTKRPGRARRLAIGWPPNVWLGTSVETPEVTGRIDALRQTPAALRLVSFEPLLAEIPDPDLEGIDWAIVGGESGPDHRPMSHEWVWPIKDAARDVGAAFFFKQSDGRHPETGRALRLPDGTRQRFEEIPDPAPAVQQARQAAASPATPGE